MQNKRIFFLLPVALLVLLACNFTTATGPQEPIDQGHLYTAAAGTLSVQLTQSALGSTATALSQPPTATGILATNTPVFTDTPAPTVTPFPSATRFPPTATPLPPTATPLPCLAVKFVKDITVPDGTEYLPGASFTKTWELQNTGSCTWNEDFQLIFVEGDQMSGDDDIPLGEDVAPGEKVQVSVDLIAPLSAGSYRGDWMLEDDDGENFGLGPRGDKTFWVSIKVEEVDEGVAFSFVDAYCSADWESDNGDLDCPGEETDNDGFVIRLSRPEQENRTEDQPALWTNPEKTDDGWISGKYPAFEIEDGDRFIADIGCLKDYEDCDVLFRLSYQIGNGDIEELGEWHEVYDGDVTRINIDLSDLEGEKVKFILEVDANGDYDEDAAFWLNAHIRRD
jgi:hypothetical protein